MVRKSDELSSGYTGMCVVVAELSRGYACAGRVRAELQMSPPVIASGSSAQVSLEADPRTERSIDFSRR